MSAFSRRGYRYADSLYIGWGWILLYFSGPALLLAVAVGLAIGKKL